MAEREKIAICVLGMHRSGTSAMAGVLNILGVPLGKKLLQPAEDNPKGFYENEKITYFNDSELLPKLNTNWHDVNIVPPDLIRNLASENPEIIEKAVKILNEEFSDTELLGIKDPRMCVIFPFWEDVLQKFGCEIKAIFIFRNPFEVAHSLFHRNGFLLRKSLLLWAKHVLYAEYYSRKYDRVFVAFDDLLNKPEAVIEKITSSLNIELSLDNSMMEEIKRFLDNNLKNFDFINFKSPFKELNFIEEIYKLLLMLNENKIEDTSDLHEMFDTLRDKYSKIAENNFSELPDLRRPSIQLYLDKGEGFNEIDSILKEISIFEKTQNFKFQIPSNVKSLRLDPLNYPCAIRIKKIILKNEKNDELNLLPTIKTNAFVSSGDRFLFTTNDPQILLNLNDNETLSNGSLELEVDIEYDSIGYDALKKELEVFVGKIDKLRADLSAKDEEILSLSSELNSIKSSVTWRAVMKWHSFVERIAPLGTTRRRWYDLGITGLRVLVREGFKGFWRSYSAYRALKKLETPSNEIVRIPTLEDWKGDEVIFPTPPQNPEVSIVIPAYNNSKLTYNCLKSILLHTNGSYEVILVDDNSHEKEAQELLNKIKNVRIIRNKENSGFIESCNIGAKASRGKYILFLNNDALVTENWLEPLLDVIKRDDVGAVGAKLVYPDGKLQEAGAIIWKDASGWNYGRFDDPNKPEYNFVREVDYCSGATLMVKREVWEKIGGFDSRFKPAYYEDTDLCFSVRKMGYKVVYQPKSVIIHFEGATSGRDTSSGVKKFQEINKPKFYEKWKDILLKEHYEPNPSNLFLARNRRKGKNILVIDHYVPTFDRDSGSYRMYNILKILSELGHNVTFIGDNLAKMEPYTSILQQMGIEVIYRPYINSIDEYLKNNGKFFDIVILSRAHIAEKHFTSVRKYCNNARIVFDTVDLQFLREMRRAKVEGNERVKKMAEKLKDLELRLAKSSDLTLVVSTYEKEILLKEDPSLKVEVLSNIHQINLPKNSFEERRDIMFLGGFTHPPNVDAVKWFVEDILPEIKKQLPDVKFYIVGSNPPREILSLNSEEIVVTGYVSDLKPYFETIRVFVAPLRYGAGVKGKIGEAMAHGLPVVTTSIGAEGMGLVNGENALIVDNPEEFAEMVVKVYKDKELWEKLSKESIKHIRSNLSYDVAKNNIYKLINLLDSQGWSNKGGCNEKVR